MDIRKIAVGETAILVAEVPHSCSHERCSPFRDDFCPLKPLHLGLARSKRCELLSDSLDLPDDRVEVTGYFMKQAAKFFLFHGYGC